MKRLSKLAFAMILLTSVLVINVSAQEKAYIPFNQVRFSIMPALYDNLKATNTSGIDNVFGSKPCIGGELNVSYYQNIIKGFGMNIGLGLNLSPYNITLDYKSYKIEDGYNYEVTQSDYNPQPLMTIPLSFNMYIPGKHKDWLANIELGAKFNYKFPNNSGSTEFSAGLSDQPSMNDEENALGILKYETSRRVLFSYFFKVGFVKVMPNKNTWHLNLVLNYSPQKVGNGSYLLRTIDGNSEGIFEQNINYIGIEAAYSITLCKKKSKPSDL